MLNDVVDNASSKGMPGIGLCLIGKNSFYIKIDDGLYILPGVKNMEVALGYLLAYYFVLHCTFPVESKFVFGFFERLCGIEKPSVTSRAVSNFINAMPLSFQK
jgi:hypothetical protein